MLPAGDIGVGAREIGVHMYGHVTSVSPAAMRASFTGKGLNWGGSLGRKEATVTVQSNFGRTCSRRAA